MTLISRRLGPPSRCLGVVTLVTTLLMTSPLRAQAPTTDHADPGQLRYSRFSGEINVPDPVSITFDNHGTAYVTQTQRRKIQDLDIREHKDWITDDVGFRTVDDKREFFRTRLAPGKDQQRNQMHVQDLNGDGSHDWRDLKVISERVHWLRDEDGDGTADSAGLFAEGFQTEVTGIAAGVLWHNGDLFATIAPDLWRLQDSDGDRVADSREVVATGFGLHIAYAGHDMHGLTVGPDGKIYWSIGDKGIAVTSREGKRFHFPNQGGVLRCDPDGSNFEVFAHGLRNVQEFDFDEYGNMFGVDNDADMPLERERFVYIIRDMDAGWRCNYQYRGDDYNPWMRERLWVPHFDGQPSHIVPAISNYIDGPAGFAFNPGTALSSAYLNHFFVAGTLDGVQYAFKARPRGASFVMEGSHEIGRGTPIIGITFAPDGALYGVDWGGGYPLNQTGAVWKIDVPNSDLAEARSEVERWLRLGLSDSTTRELEQFMEHADRRIRLASQFGLVKRGELDSLVDLTNSDSEMARIHSIWGLGQLSRGGNTQATAALIPHLRSDDAEMRAQTARTLSDSPPNETINGELFVPLLKDTSPRVQLMAMTALSHHPTSAATDELLDVSDGLRESQRYLRFAVSQALAACATGKRLSDERDGSSKVGRLNLVVALRGNSDPRWLKPFLYDEDPQVATEAARALHDDLSDHQRLADLSRLLSDTQHDEEPLLRRALNANYRRGGTEELNCVLAFAADSTQAKPLRVEALTMLGGWKSPDALDRVDGRRRYVESERNFDDGLVATVLSQLALDNDPQIQTTAIRSARQAGVALSTSTLVNVAKQSTLDAELRIEALRALESQGGAEVAPAIARAINDTAAGVRIAAVDLLLPRDAARAEDHILGVLKSSRNRSERQHAIVQLGHLESKRSAEALIALLERRSAGKLPVAVELEVLEAAAARRDSDDKVAGALARSSESVEQRRASTPQPLRSFIASREGGNPAAGEEIFRTNLSAQCVRCHRVGGQGSDVGPNLKGIASKKDRDYLLRSIVMPSADIDKKYQTESFLMFSGQMLKGVVKEETDDETVIVDAQGREIRLDNDEIEAARKNDVSIMPEMKDVLTPRQIRDLVAYLATLK